MWMDSLLGPEGWTSVCLAHMWLTISSVKHNMRGKWCFTYHLLFSKVSVLFPKESSWIRLQQLAQVSDTSSHGRSVTTAVATAEGATTRTRKKIKSSQKRKQQEQETAVASSVVTGEEWMQRCQNLDLDTYDGHTLIALHHQTYPMGLKLWNDLDTTWVLTFSSVLSVLLIRNISALVRSLFSTSGMTMEGQLMQDRSGITLIHLVLLFAFGRLLHLAYKCSTPVDSISGKTISGKQVKGRLSMFSYWAGITTGLIGMLASYSSSSHDNRSDWNLFQDGMNLKAAMEELSVRLFLLIRWILCSTEKDVFEQDEEWWLQTLERICHASLIGLISLIVTVMATPIFETWQMAIPLFLLPPNDGNTKNNQSSPESSFRSRLKRYYIKAVIVAMILLPILYMASYTLPFWTLQLLNQLSDSSWTHYGYDLYPLFRAALGWVFCILSISIISTGFLRKHCKDAITQVVHGPLLSTKAFTKNDIHGPFRRQFQTLVSTACHLSCFPIWVILLLTTAHLHHPTTLSNNHQPSCDGGVNLYLTNPSFINTPSSSLKNCIIEPPHTLMSTLPPKQCWLRSTPLRHKLQTFLVETEQRFFQTQFCNVPESTPSEIKDLPHLTNKITPRHLLQLAPQFKKSVLQSLRSILLSQSSSSIGEIEDPPCDARDIMRHLSNTILQHSIFTSTILLPMVETIAFMTCAVWVILSLPIVFLYTYSIYQSRQKKKQKQKLQ